MRHKGLLPAGLSDLLPPDAAFEASLTERLVAAFAARGYQRVKPPLVEFEDNLLSGTGAAMASQVFRLMDPVSQRMMGVRADMTPQIARIAACRLGAAPRPLRLCYAGQVLRVRGGQTRPERQFAQIGAELIGSFEPAADAEVIVMAYEALCALGVENVTIDLGLPTLVPALLADRDLGPGPAAAVRDALDHKDTAALDAAAAALGGEMTDILKRLVLATGPAAESLAEVGEIPLGEGPLGVWRELCQVVDLVTASAPGITLTIDPVEHRGLEYHTGVTFSLFAKGVRGELGSGGRYLAGGGTDDGQSEPATGFTLFTDSLLRALPRPAEGRRLYVPFGTAAEVSARLRVDGWITVDGLSAVADAAAEAARLGCDHLLDGDAPRPVDR